MKQHIRVSRYDLTHPTNVDFKWHSSVSASDGSWVMFVPTSEAQTDGLEPQLWIRCGTRVDENGDVQDNYVFKG